jgi:hypothetical protein
MVLRLTLVSLAAWQSWRIYNAITSGVVGVGRGPLRAWTSAAESPLDFWSIIAMEAILLALLLAGLLTLPIWLSALRKALHAAKQLPPQPGG